MEKFRIFLKSRAYFYIALLIGTISLLFIGQEKQYGIFAWLAPIFLLQSSRRAKPLQFLIMFFLFVVAGCITQNTHNLFNDPVFLVINGIAYAIVFMGVYLIDRALYQKGKSFLYTLIFPTTYITIEAVLTTKLGTSGVLAHTQFSFKALAQLTTITGMHGVSFLICWFASIVYWLSENDFRSGFIRKGATYFALVFIIIFSFGFIRIASKSENQQQVKVATVSGPFDLHQLAKTEKDALLQLVKTPNMKIPTSFFSNQKDISVQLENTRKAAESGAKIIVWNEAALFLNQEQLDSVITETKNISKAFSVYILIAFFEENSSSDTKPLNNKSILITKDRTIGWEYKKSHLTPAEIPLINPGNSIIPTFDTEYGRIANVICYDYDFPSLLQEANKNNVDIMLVPSYDWAGFADMHSKMAQLETLQNRWSLVRANGKKGVSAVINSYGDVVSKLNSIKSKEQVLYADLPLNTTNTIYSKMGNLFTAICLVCFVLFISVRITSFYKQKKHNLKKIQTITMF